MHILSFTRLAYHKAMILFCILITTAHYIWKAIISSILIIHTILPLRMLLFNNILGSTYYTLYVLYRQITMRMHLLNLWLDHSVIIILTTQQVVSNKLMLMIPIKTTHIVIIDELHMISARGAHSYYIHTHPGYPVMSVLCLCTNMIPNNCSIINIVTIVLSK